MRRFVCLHFEYHNLAYGHTKVSLGTTNCNIQKKNPRFNSHAD